MSKIKIGQAYQPTRLTRRGPSGSYSAYRPLTGHLPLDADSAYHRRMDRIVFATSVVGWIVLAVLMLAGVIT
jgi:hypothetical protein